MLHLIPDPDPDGIPTEPRLAEAGLAIDALGALVDALGDRLAPTTRRSARRSPSCGWPSSSGSSRQVTSRDRGLRAHRRHPDRGARRRRRLDRLAVRAAVRLRRRASRRCSATTRNGRWLLAPGRRAAARPRRYRDGTLVLETEFETARGHRPRHRLHADPRPDRRHRADRRGRPRPRRRCAWSSSSASTTARSCRGCAAPTASHRDHRRARRAVPAHAGRARTARTCATVAEFTVGAGDRVPFVPRLVPVVPDEPPRRIDAADAIARRPTLVAGVAEPLHVRRRLARGGACAR